MNTVESIELPFIICNSSSFCLYRSRDEMIFWKNYFSWYEDSKVIDNKLREYRLVKFRSLGGVGWLRGYRWVGGWINQHVRFDLELEFERELTAKEVERIFEKMATRQEEFGPSRVKLFRHDLAAGNFSRLQDFCALFDKHLQEADSDADE